jgi:thymidylate synthase
MTRFDQEYKKLLFKIYNQGFEETNARTGQKTKIITGAHFDFDANHFPLLTLRRIPTKLFIAEQIWYLQGTKDLSFFQQFSKGWDSFKEADNTVDSGYGYRWRSHFQRDQILGLVNMLTDEPSSRQGVVVTWDPNSDGLDSPKIKNVPCIPVWVANIVNNKLNFHIVFRSNDIMLGFPHDVAGFALLQHIIAQKVGVGVGCLHYSVSHAHIYANHYEQAEDILSRNNQHREIKLTLPENSFDRALAGDIDLVTEIFENIKSQYTPLSKVERMQIAL